MGSIVLLIFLAIGLAFWLWPRFSDVDTYRPRIVEALTKTTGRPVTIGHVEARLFPRPQLVALNVTLFSHNHPDQPLVAADKVALRFYFVPVLQKQFKPRIITLESPRLFLTRDTTSWAQVLDEPLPVSSAPVTAIASTEFPLQRVDVMDGNVTFTDHTFSPARQARLEQVTGSFVPQTHQGDMHGLAPAWGMPARFTLHIDQQAMYPFDLHVENVHLRNFEGYFPKLNAWLSGTLNARIKIKNKTAFEFQIERLALARFPGIVWKGNGAVSGERLTSHYEVLGTTRPMHGDLHCLLRSDPLDIQATVDDYSPEVTQQLTAISWITRLDGAGHAHLTLRRSLADNAFDWLVEGGSFTFTGTDFAIHEVRVSGDNAGVNVETHFQADAGTAAVTWAKLYKSSLSTLNVTASSITVRDILPVFNWARDAPQTSTGIFHPQAWRNLHLSRVRLSATIAPHRVFTVKRAAFHVEEAHAHVSGTFGLQGRGAPAHIEGKVEHIPLEPFMNRFFSGRAYLTGTAGCEYNLDFPLVPAWSDELDGTMTVHADTGVVRSFKTLYDVLAVTNLANYFTLQLPKLHDEGIPYQNISGHFAVSDGAFSTKDLFMKTENTNIAAEGVVDVPGQEIDATLRIQFFRLIEDVLHAIPGLKWIFSDQHKILLPIVVKVRGPWRQVEVE